MIIEFRKSPGIGLPSDVTCYRNGFEVISWNLHEFFEARDLCHYAVEQTLGYENGIWGQLARGCSPQEVFYRSSQSINSIVAHQETLYSDMIVGLLQAESCVTHKCWGQLLSDLLDRCLSRGLPFPELETNDLVHVHSVQNGLLSAWKSLTRGEVLRLEFAPNGLPISQTA